MEKFQTKNMLDVLYGMRRLMAELNGRIRCIEEKIKIIGVELCFEETDNALGELLFGVDDLETGIKNFEKILEEEI